MTSGARFFAYTDGIIVAPNPNCEIFGLDRLKEALDANI
jgi:serine phosphatase RsbU (regulator of sigma subunit)